MPEGRAAWTFTFRRGRRPGFAPQGGFTLVEMLVALAITGALVSVLMSSLFHIFRVQEYLREEVQVRERELRGRAWFREILSNCLAVEDKEALAFKGSPKEISCESTGAIVPASLPVITAVRLSLTERQQYTVPSAQSMQTVLSYQETGNGEKESRVLDLAAWASSGVEFRFIDADGVERDSWPPNKSRYEALPREIRLLLGNTKDSEIENVWRVAVKADPWLPEKQALPQGITEDMFR